jgi:Tfp pilus assembly protein PilO
MFTALRLGAGWGVNNMGVRLSKRERFLVALVAVAGLLFMYHQYLFSPLLDNIGVLREEVEGNKERLRDIKGTNNDINLLTASIDKLETRIRELEILIPQSSRTPEIVTHMEAFSEAAGVKLLSIDFSPGVLPEGEERDNQGERGYLEIPLEIYISGTYEGVLDFLGELEASGRLYNVGGFDLYPAYTEDSGNMDMIIRLSAYSLAQGDGPKPRPETYEFKQEDYGRSNPFALAVD